MIRDLLGLLGSRLDPKFAPSSDVVDHHESPWVVENLPRSPSSIKFHRRVRREESKHENTQENGATYGHRDQGSGVITGAYETRDASIHRVEVFKTAKGRVLITVSPTLFTYVSSPRPRKGGPMSSSATPARLPAALGVIAAVSTSDRESEAEAKLALEEWLGRWAGVGSGSNFTADSAKAESPWNPARPCTAAVASAVADTSWPAAR